MADDTADEDVDEIVLDARSFTGPERRLVQDKFEAYFGDLLTYTFDAIRTDRKDRLPPLERRDGSLVFPDEVLQFMVWVQVRRTDPEAKLEDFDHLTLRHLNNARARGFQGKATGPGPSTTSSPGSSSADSSRT